MRQIWVVLRREYLERVKTKGFIIGTIAIPLLMIGVDGAQHLHRGAGRWLRP